MKNNNTPQKSSLPARTVCARIIAEWITTRDFPERMLPEHSSERALIQEMVYGICRHKRALEASRNCPTAITSPPI